MPELGFPKRKRSFLWALVLAVIATASYYAILIMPLPFAPSWWAVEDFDLNERFHLRHRIADSLVASSRLEGKTREEIVALLGEPPQTDYFSDWDLVYGLGMERGLFSIDGEWLVIRLDASGRAIEARIVRD